MPPPSAVLDFGTRAVHNGQDPSKGKYRPAMPSIVNFSGNEVINLDHFFYLMHGILEPSAAQLSYIFENSLKIDLYRQNICEKICIFFTYVIHFVCLAIAITKISHNSLEI